ncbi:MAG TPA: PSD1 and planctomycete cytochrome C domain-containing protein [Pirellulales bacterium]|nr:PSD1 and planctomycete cytochrome C domain-containing protein [Pirellulales bacterium]
MAVCPAGRAAESESAKTLPASSTVDFVKQIRPIFEQHCYACHGPKKQESELRLDARDAALKGGFNGPAIVKGQSAASELIKRVASDDPNAMMPPKGERLLPEQIASLRAWIDQGAVWPDDGSGAAAAEKRKHWAFQPPKRPAEPAVSDMAWVRNAIDRFVLARLEREQPPMRPSPEADKTTLLRRLSLDLIGLPPTIAEVDAFLADDSPDAYEKQVEWLLKSPHYGERWGRHWLDAARYADSDGYEKDKSRQVWAYRDWVVEALNRDLPYDQFIVEQLAGDLLPGASQDQRVATGFLRNSMINEEGGVDPEQFRMEAMFDRMDAIGKSVLGLTIQCGQCHNHKYDPLTQEEYYRMFAFLNNAYEANIAIYTPQEQMVRGEIFRRIREIEADLQHRRPGWAERMAEWEERVRGDQPEWTVLRFNAEGIPDGGEKYFPLEDGSILAQGYAPTKHRVKFSIKVDAANITAFRLELLNHADLPLGGPGRSIQGTGALTEFEIEAAPADHPEQTAKVKFVQATSDVELPETPLAAIYDDRSDKRRVTGPASFAIDGKDETAWGIDAGPGRRNQPRKAVFVAEKPISHPAGTVLNVYLKQFHGGWNSDDNQNHNLGRFRVSVTSAADAKADPLPLGVRQVLAVPREERTPEQTVAVFFYWRTTVPEWQAANAEIETLWKQHPEGDSQLVLQNREQPRETHLLQRGDFLKPARSVEPGVPSFLHPLPADAEPSRLSFARWLADRNSPTTARSIVNRVWQTDFGIGLVATSEDLGVQSEPPSHPELLDWLAVELMDRGWSLKALHRTIVTSATYRQSSRVSPELHARDPYNRLLARGPRFRLEAEAVRDAALAASGLLNPKLGGPSVYPPAPDFLFLPPASYGPKVWREAQGEDRYRRAIYTFRFRSVPYPVLQTFDAPNGDFSCVRRARSNTPLQALVTLNEPLFVECAQALALRTLRDGGANDESRLNYAFRRCLSRAPDDVERQELLGLLARETKHFAEGWTNVQTVAYLNPSEPPQLPPGATPTQLASWTMVARVVLNLDEAISKE